MALADMPAKLLAGKLRGQKMAEKALLPAVWQARPGPGDACAGKLGQQIVHVTVQLYEIHCQSGDGELEGGESHLRKARLRQWGHLG